MTEREPALPWKWIGAFFVVLMAYGTIAGLTKANRKETRNFPIAGVHYDWPTGTSIGMPRPPGAYGNGWVRYYPAEPKDSNFRLIYDGNRQESQNEAGLPHLHTITTRFSRRDEYSFHQTAVGQVVCDRKLAQIGYLFPCGLSFMHRGAGWQLQFAASKVPNTEELKREAVTRLEEFRSGEP